MRLSWASAAGRRRGLAAAERISPATALQAGGEEGDARRQRSSPFWAAPAERFTLRRSGCTDVHRSALRPRLSPTSLVGSPPEMKLRIGPPDRSVGRK